MRNFAYAVAERPQDAFAADDANIMAIAGGTELLNWFRLGIAAPSKIIDLGGIAGLDRIERRNDLLVIGALANLNQVGEHELVRQHAAALSHAALAAASPQVRNRATIGGNPLQKTRCAYFRAEAPVPWPCNKRSPGTGCAAREGLNDRLAIFGWTDACVATQPSDPIVALAALDAEIELVGPKGRRLVPAAQFHLTQEEAASVGLDAARAETRIHPGEVIEAYRVPIHEQARSAYVKVRERASYEYALVSAAAVLNLDDGRITRASVVLGSVAQKPWPLLDAQECLVGQPPTREAVLPILKNAMRAARPLAGNGYKVQMAVGAAARAITLAGSAA
ncbi:MAG: FAD binding domain-containing protein [Alphaproteobacteria bacterium]|nr:FAD binding domain-containing protein [Alphaproteobacteria bacterium]